MFYIYTSMVLYLEGEFVLSLSRMLMFGVEAIPTHCIDVNSPPTSAGPLILQKLLGEYLTLVVVFYFIYF